MGVFSKFHEVWTEIHFFKIFWSSKIDYFSKFSDTPVTPHDSQWQRVPTVTILWQGGDTPVTPHDSQWQRGPTVTIWWHHMTVSDSECRLSLSCDKAVTHGWHYMTVSDSDCRLSLSCDKAVALRWHYMTVSDSDCRLSLSCGKAVTTGDTTDTVPTLTPPIYNADASSASFVYYLRFYYFHTISLLFSSPKKL